MSTRPRLSEWESTWAFVTGGGLLLVILAFGLGAMRGPDSAGALNGMLLIGALLFVGGTVGWLVQFRPWEKFDDQSTPLYTGHEGHDDHASHDTPAAHSDQGAHGEAHIEPHVPTVQAEAHPVEQPGEVNVTEPDQSKVDIEGHLPQIFNESKMLLEKPAAPTPSPLPPPPEIMDPITAFPPATEAPPSPKQDKLQMLQGIGPQIEGALNRAGVQTFADLAQRSPADLEKIVRDAGVRMVGHAETWVKQAEFAAKGDLDGLKAFQATLH